jgi:hypothetical protein
MLEIRMRLFPLARRMDEISKVADAALRQALRAELRCRPLMMLCILMFLVVNGGTSLRAGCVSSGAEVENETLRAAIAFYQEGWAGSDEALREAMARLERMDREAPDDPLVLAYLGSSRIALVRLVPDRQKRALLVRGARELDGAVAAAPQDVQIRLLRATTFSVLPRLAGRMETVEQDLGWLLARLEAEDLDAACRYAILYLAGSFHLRERQPASIGFLERAEKVAPAAEEKDRATRLLRLARSQLGADK